MPLRFDAPQVFFFLALQQVISQIYRLSRLQLEEGDIECSVPRTVVFEQDKG